MREEYFEDLKEEYEEIRQDHYDSLKVRVADRLINYCHGKADFSPRPQLEGEPHL